MTKPSEKRAERARRSGEEQRLSRLKTKLQQLEPQTAQAQREPSQKQTPTLRRRLWGVVVSASVLATLMAFVYQFRPTVLIEPDISLNLQQPFAQQFKITNTGALLALHDVEFACDVDNPNMHNVQIINSIGQEKVDVLDSGDSATRSCPAIGDPDAARPPVIAYSGAYPFNSAIEISVSARRPWHLGRMLWQARFENMRDSSGAPKWVRQPNQKSK
jgi:hypothetical protein